MSTIDSLIVVNGLAIGFSHFDGFQRVLADSLYNSIRGKQYVSVATLNAALILELFDEADNIGVLVLNEADLPPITHTVHVVNIDYAAHVLNVTLYEAADYLADFDEAEPLVTFSYDAFIKRHGLA